MLVLTGLYTSVSVLASNLKQKLSLHHSRQIEPCASLFDLSADILLIFGIMSLPSLHTAGWGSLLVFLFFRLLTQVQQRDGT